MQLFAIGLNHRSAPLELRSRFAFTLDQLVPTLGGVQNHLRVGISHPEVALLSTCNRTELYFSGQADIAQGAIDWLAGIGGVSARYLLDHAYVLESEAAVRHALRVASGLDSMVLGETQILGQMKRALREAEAAGTLGTTLHQLFQRAFSVAKEVRSSTEIGAQSISMAAAAVRIAAQTFEDLHDASVLFVGAGEMIERVATHFAARAPRRMAIANRSFEHGQAMAQRFGAQTLSLSDMPHRLAEFDVVVSCTASPQPVILADAVERALASRQGRPMVIVDLAVPRDTAPDVAGLEGVELYTVDDLASRVQVASATRQAAVDCAERIVDAGVQGFVRWLAQRNAVPMIQALKECADDWRAVELARARKRLARGEDVESVLDTLARGLTNKMLHGAMTELRGGTAMQHREVGQWLPRLFVRCPAKLANGMEPVSLSGAVSEARGNASQVTLPEAATEIG